jgi:hypothetical protein
MNSNGATPHDTMPKIARDLEAQIAVLRAQNANPPQHAQQAHQAMQQAQQPVTPAELFARQPLSPVVFEQQAEAICKGVFRMLVDKNRAYGNSVFDPVRVFSKASVDEQINVRLDDKLSRIQKGNADLMDEDVLIDTIGYLIIKLIAKQQAGLGS